jgi:hypothetical protein
MLTVTQGTIGTVPSVLAVVPPGPATVVVSNPSGSVVVYYGFGGTAVTSSNGMALPAGQSHAWACCQGGRGGTISVVAASGTANTVGALVSAPSGGTGL